MLKFTVTQYLQPGIKKTYILSDKQTLKDLWNAVAADVVIPHLHLRNLGYYVEGKLVWLAHTDILGELISISDASLVSHVEKEFVYQLAGFGLPSLLPRPLDAVKGVNFFATRDDCASSRKPYPLPDIVSVEELRSVIEKDLNKTHPGQRVTALGWYNVEGRFIPIADRHLCHPDSEYLYRVAPASDL